MPDETYFVNSIELTATDGIRQPGATHIDADVTASVEHQRYQGTLASRSTVKTTGCATAAISPPAVREKCPGRSY